MLDKEREKTIMACVLCDRNFVTSYNFYSTDTIHSETPVREFCKKIIGEDLKAKYNESEIICENCYEIINELDMIAQKSKELIEGMKQRYISKLQAEQKIIITNQDKTEIYTVISLSPPPAERQRGDLNNEDTNLNKLRSSSPETENALQYGMTGVEKIHFSNENDLKSILEAKYNIKEEIKTEEKLNETEELDNWDTTILSDDQDVSVIYDMMDEENVEIKVEPKKSVEPKNPLQCDKCSEVIETKEELKLHKANHAKENPFICEICGKVYRHKSALDVHVGMHKGINPFQCLYCHKTFTQKGALIRHVKIHTGEKPFQCEECGKCFTHHTSFNIHKISHSGKKDYKCGVCGLCLNSSSHLKRHMRVHTGEKRHLCPMCGKRFAEKYNLVTHVKLHNGEGRIQKKKFRCGACGLSCRRREELEEHFLKIHSMEIFLSEAKEEEVVE